MSYFQDGGHDATLQKSLSVVSKWISMKSGKNIVQVNMHRLMNSDCWFNITTYKMAAMTSFTQKSVPPGEYTWNICPQVCLCRSKHQQQFLIYITFILFY